jgi:hypothetical protein
MWIINDVVKHDEHSPKTNREHKTHEKYGHCRRSRSDVYCWVKRLKASECITADDRRRGAINATAQPPPAPAPEPHDADEREPQPRPAALLRPCVQFRPLPEPHHSSERVGLEPFCFCAVPFDSGKLHCSFCCDAWKSQLDVSSVGR